MAEGRRSLRLREEERTSAVASAPPTMAEGRRSLRLREEERTSAVASALASQDICCLVAAHLPPSDRLPFALAFSSAWRALRSDPSSFPLVSDQATIAASPSRVAWVVGEGLLEPFNPDGRPYFCCLYHAASEGDVPVLRALERLAGDSEDIGGTATQRLRDDRRAKCVETACMRGHMSALRWMRPAAGAPCPRPFGRYPLGQACLYAAANGQLRALRWAHDEEGGEIDARTAREAAAASSLPCLKYLQRKGVEFDSEVANECALSGSLPCLRYAVKKGSQLTAVCSSLAAFAGDLGVLRYLTERTACPVDESACAAAARGGHMACLLHLADTVGVPLQSPTITEAAAEKGALDMLQLLRARECSWGPGVARKAAANGHLETLTWALNNGCPFDSSAALAAALGGAPNRAEVSAYLAGLGCLPPRQAVVEMELPFGGGQFAIQFEVPVNTLRAPPSPAGAREPN